MKKPKVLVVRAGGINCEVETVNSFNFVGGQAELVHIKKIISGKVKMDNYDIMAWPGGFSYGDNISGGAILASKARAVAGDILEFIESGRPVLGVCNGFQVLLKLALMPFPGETKQTASLAVNDCGVFIGKWVKILVNKKSPCIFTKELPDQFDLPIAHGEGKFVVDSPETLKRITDGELHALTYADNPNGSVADIAGVTTAKGNCLGLMPHPERATFWFQHPARVKTAETAGMQILKNAVEYVK